VHQILARVARHSFHATLVLGVFLMSGCGSELKIDGQSIAETFSDPMGAESHVTTIERANAVEVFTSIESEIRIRWRRIDYAESYDVSITSDSSCKQVLQTLENLTTRSASFDPLDDGDYFACLIARNKDGGIIAKTFVRYEFSVDSEL